MKIALLSDIHANRQALDACLAHARAQGARQFALLGDLVGYGGDPAAVVDQAMALAQEGALIVQGNHDAAAVTPPAQATQLAMLGVKSIRRVMHPQIGIDPGVLNIGVASNPIDLRSLQAVCARPIGA